MLPGRCRLRSMKGHCFVRLSFRNGALRSDGCSHVSVSRALVAPEFGTVYGSHSWVPLGSSVLCKIKRTAAS